jgi:DNA-binding beta-propeller fold protein YncE
MMVPGGATALGLLLLGGSARLAAQETARPTCALAGPPVEAAWSGRPAAAAAADTTALLRLAADVPMPGTPSRFDYQSFDPRTGRLYISHMNAGQLVVFDVRTQHVLANLDGFPRVTGVIMVPAEGRAYASAAGSHEVVVVDDSSLRVVAHIPGPTFPDGLAYAPAERRVFVSDESGQREFVIDARTDHRVAVIPLGGEAGNTQYDSRSHCVVVAVQTLNQLVFIDPGSARIVRRVTLDRAVLHPHGVYIDAPRRLAFVAGERSATVGVLDLRTLHLAGVVPVGEDPDVLAFDPQLSRLYVASESGVVSVLAAEGTTLRPLGNITVPYAHTVAVDPRTHRVYLPLENLDGKPVLRVMDVSGSARQP